VSETTEHLEFDGTQDLDADTNNKIHELERFLSPSHLEKARISYLFCCTSESEDTFCPRLILPHMMLKGADGRVRLVEHPRGLTKAARGSQQ